MSSGGEPIVRLRHGTTRQRAESILLNGPNPRFVEPGGLDPARGFSTDRADKPYVYPSPEDYAAKKALNFPNEGGAAVVEIEVPESIVQKADVIVKSDSIWVTVWMNSSLLGLRFLRGFYCHER